jgi:hypothetical protein
MYYFVILRIDLISIFSFSHDLLVFSIFHRENVKSEAHTPLIKRETFVWKKICLEAFLNNFLDWVLPDEIDHANQEAKRLLHLMDKHSNDKKYTCKNLSESPEIFIGFYKLFLSN